MKQLTERQQRFAELVVEGLSYTEAYKKSYRDASPWVRSKASRLATNVNIQNYIQELRRTQRDKSLMTLDEKRRSLAEVVRTPVASILRADGSVDMDFLRGLPTSVLKSVTIKEGKDAHGNTVRSYSIVFADKLRAMAMDTKLAGVDHRDEVDPAAEEKKKREQAEACERGRKLIKELVAKGHFHALR